MCSSSFVNDDWINYVFESWGSTPVSVQDFRVIGPFQFQALQTLCRLVNDTISNSLTRFYASQYVSTVVTPSLLLQSLVDAFVSQFVSTTTKDFSSSFRIVRDTIQANSLSSSVQSNAQLKIIPGSQFVASSWTWYE